MEGRGVHSQRGGQGESGQLGDFASGLWAGLKISVPGIALGCVWKDGTLPALVATHAQEVVCAAVVLLVVHLLSDARFLRRMARRLRSSSNAAEGTPLPHGWTTGTLDDGTSFWFHCDAPDDIRFEMPQSPLADGQSRLERPSSDSARSVVALADYGLSGTRGCLLPERPGTNADQRSLLPPALRVLESMARGLPRWLADSTGSWRTELRNLNWTRAQQKAAVLAVNREGLGAVQRTRMVLAFLVHAWRCPPCSRSDVPPPLPQWVSGLWGLLNDVDESTVGRLQCASSMSLDYANYVLHNCEIVKSNCGQHLYRPVLSFTGNCVELKLLTCLLAIEAAGGQALLDSVKAQKAARDWDSEGVAESLQAVRTTLSGLRLIIIDHLQEFETRMCTGEHADARRSLSQILRVSQEDGSDALQPSGIFAAVAALLGIHTSLDGVATTSALPSFISGTRGDKNNPSLTLITAENGSVAKGLLQPSEGTDLAGYIAAVAAGPSVEGFARHCWEALEGASSGDCPFVGTREYAVLEAFDKCALSLTELYEKFSELRTYILCPVIGSEERLSPSHIASSAPSHASFLKDLADSEVRGIANAG